MAAEKQQLTVQHTYYYTYVLYGICTSVWCLFKIFSANMKIEITNESMKKENDDCKKWLCLPLLRCSLHLWSCALLLLTAYKSCRLRVLLKDPEVVPVAFDAPAVAANAERAANSSPASPSSLISPTRSRCGRGTIHLRVGQDWKNETDPRALSLIIQLL